MNWTNGKIPQVTLLMCAVFLMGIITVGCSSTPEPETDPSKKDIQQDSDRFFKKMDQEEGQQAPLR
jgi:hypothetical protein